jgi:hypothetical protein
MEAMLGISLYSYLYLILAKTLCFSYYLLCLLFNKIREQEGRTGSAWKLRGGEKVAQIMYTHVSKCKNNNKKNTQTLTVQETFVSGVCSPTQFLWHPTPTPRK